MSRRLSFALESNPDDPLCDLCFNPTTKLGGAIVVHLGPHAPDDPPKLVACPSCSVDFACFVIREYWPRLEPPSPPETPPPASGGGGA